MMTLVLNTVTTRSRIPGINQEHCFSILDKQDKGNVMFTVASCDKCQTPHHWYCRIIVRLRSKIMQQLTDFRFLFTDATFRDGVDVGLLSQTV